MNFPLTGLLTILILAHGTLTAPAQESDPKPKEELNTQAEVDKEKAEPKKPADAKPPKYDPGKTYAPTPVPDRIILTWSGDPATTQSVSWRTDVSVSQAVAEVALAGDGPQMKTLSAAAVTSQRLTTNLGTAVYHSATFGNLEPDTKYVFRVGDGTNWSEWSHFHTASTSAKPFSFIYFGDAQNKIKTHWSRVIREAFKDAPRAAFLLHCGDLVDKANDDALWGEWFEGGGWINRTMPSMPTPGNHEYKDGKLSIQWKHLFTLPQHGPAGLEETVYYIDYQGARIISLNSTRGLDEQVEWFHEIMKSNPNRWTIVAMHHPVFSTARDRDNKNLRQKFKPLFDQYQIDIVLQGHDHSYGRTGLVNEDLIYNPEPEAADEEKSDEEQSDEEQSDEEPEENRKGNQQHDHHHDHSHVHVENVMSGLQVQDKESGTMYVVSVSGPKQYKVGDDELFRRTGQDKQLYQIITINNDELNFSAYTASGRLHDRFTLKKKEGHPNQLIEQVPAD